MQKKIYWGSPETNSLIKEAFLSGKALLAESDTIWGLFIPATAEGAHVLDRLKKRRDKPYLVIMDSVPAVEKVVLFPENGCHKLALQGWPGPLTLLLPANKGELVDAQSAVGVVGIRVPDHPLLRVLAKEYGGLFSTSANISGEPVPITYEQVDPLIRDAVGVVIYNDPDYIPCLQASTIVDCTGTTLKVVRHGAYPMAQLTD